MSLNETKLPPEDLDAEQCVLGACMQSDAALGRARPLVPPGAFYREAHNEIWDAILTICDLKQPVDVVTVAVEMARRGKSAACGGIEYLEACCGAVPTVEHVIRYAEIVANCATLRALIAAGAQIVEEGYSYPEDAGGAVNRAAERIAAICAGHTGRRGAQLAGDYAQEMLVRLENALTAPPHVSAVRTGIPTLDQRMGGLGGHTLVVPRGVEKAGKSMFGLQCALATARRFRDAGDDRCVACYVLEGQAIWEERAIAWLGNFDAHMFMPSRSVPDPEFQKFQTAAREWAELPIYLTGEIASLDDIITDVRRIELRQKVGLVLIDYAQLIQGGRGGSAVEAAEDRANQLAAFAAEIHAPIIVPSQLTQGEGGARHAKWARAWDEAASLVFDVERGPKGAMREEWQTSTEGRLRLHACRRRPPFAIYELRFDLATGHITDGRTPEESAQYER